MVKSEGGITAAMCGVLHWENSPCMDGDIDTGREEGIWTGGTRRDHRAATEGRSGSLEAQE